MLDSRDVIIYTHDSVRYPSEPPFHPGSLYPECVFDVSPSSPNDVYETVRQCFRIGLLDSEEFGKKGWNPFKRLVRSGETVLLKPNLVKEAHSTDPEGWKYIITHGSVIRAVSDYLWKAMELKGSIIVADAPQTDSSFSEIARLNGLEAVQNFYVSHGLDFRLIDLRRHEWVTKQGVIITRRRLEGDPKGYVKFNLAEKSEFAGHKGSGRYYGADYNSEVVNRHHNNGRHEYLVSGTAISCDVIFSLPKLKTHKKAGITVSLKNLVGINGDKNWLPHHTEGDPSKGGDEHPSPTEIHKIERQIVPYFRSLSLRLPRLGPLIHRYARRLGAYVFGNTEEVIRSGNWWGNDTTWRMCLDLNKIALYGNSDGTMRLGSEENRKRHYVLVDGIIAGEGNGPMNPKPVSAGVIAFALNPASVDAACACLMGYDPERIPIVRNAFRCREYPIADWPLPDVRVVSNNPDRCGRLTEIAPSSTFHFQPHFGWRGHIERDLI
jgi:uncharacterized protein (DUF362 family)